MNLTKASETIPPQFSRPNSPTATALATVKAIPAVNGGGAHAKAPFAAVALPKTKPQQAAAQPAAPARSMAAVMSTVGLPTDTLSASIVLSARFFSLPLKPELMTAIRRQVLAAADSGELAAERGLAGKGQAVLSLVVAAAESKGVELSPEALKNYAAAVDPDRQGQAGKRDNDERGSGKRRKGQRKIYRKAAPIAAFGVRELIAGSARGDALHALMNRLPDRDGKRWMVFPFSFAEGGREYRASLRVLLDGAAALRGHAALDIVEYGAVNGGAISGAGGAAGRRWLFALEHSSGGITRLDAYLQPALAAAEKKAFTRKLAALMEIPEDRVSAGNYGESFPWMPVLHTDLLHTVNEKV